MKGISGQGLTRPRGKEGTGKDRAIVTSDLARREQLSGARAIAARRGFTVYAAVHFWWRILIERIGGSDSVSKPAGRAKRAASVVLRGLYTPGESCQCCAVVFSFTAKRVRARPTWITRVPTRESSPMEAIERILSRDSIAIGGRSPARESSRFRHQLLRYRARHAIELHVYSLGEHSQSPSIDCGNAETVDSQFLAKRASLELSQINQFT